MSEDKFCERLEIPEKGYEFKRVKKFQRNMTGKMNRKEGDCHRHV